MSIINRLLKQKKGDMPGWGYFILLIIGLIALGVFIYFATKSGKLIPDILGWLD